MKFKKPKFWDLKKRGIMSYILLPFTIPIILNNFLLRKSLKKTRKELVTICVGNIYIGGTGKTPTALKLYKALKNLDCKVAIGKKFYKSQIDEKILLEKKTSLITFNSRKEIIETAIQNNIGFLVFDDGLQDRNVSYDVKIVCFDQNWIGNGNLIPAGPLREKISSLKKYDVAILKEIDLTENNAEILIKKINPEIKIFHSYFEVTNLNNFDLSKNFLFFSGIGNPENFKKTLLKNNFKIVDEIIYPDHHNYNEKDIIDIKNRAKKINAKIITTEKDYVKISQIDKKEIEFLEVELKIKNEKSLIDYLKNKNNEKH